MTQIIGGLKGTNSKRLVALTRNLSILEDDNQDTVISELRFLLLDVVRAVEELQGLQAASRELDSDGYPEHGARCEILDGQFIHLTQDAAAPNVIAVEHKLDRIPQGAIWVKHTAANEIFIEGRITAPEIRPATTTEVSFELNGSNGDRHICILF